MKPELLAPAKDMETGIIAINCGADAVYIGANKFGARLNAGNSLEDIEKLIEHAHKYWAKIYVTINTLLADKELVEANQLIKKLYEIGTDALIIQDMGLLELDLPPIPLIASTQCHNNTWQKINFLEKVGFQRVILPRELTLEQIKEIRSNTTIELESFIHGALCVSYSGQCYLSYANGGRSGNRGGCAQPCRKSYTLNDAEGNVLAKDKYLLSLKDLNLSNYLNDLEEAGISSFKIEGRLKDANYIKNIVSYYRHKIDNTTPEFEFNPDKTFNRGYTRYFITGRYKDITSFNSPKHIGEPMGRVEEAKLHNGDGITFFDNDGVLQGTNELQTLNKGTFIYRNYDYDYIKQLKSLKIARKIKVNVDFNNKFLILTDESGNSVQYQIEQAFEPANNSQQALDNINKQLLKFGDTIFSPEEVNINLKPVPFIPVSVLNDIRRKAIELLEAERQYNYPRKTFKIVKNDFPYPEKELNYTANVMNSSAKLFYNRHGAEVTELAAESGIDMSGKRLMTTKHCLKYQFGLCKKSDKELYLSDGKSTYSLQFDCERCEMHIY